MIGTEHESRGLYYLKNDANSVACVNSTSLWDLYFRFDHLILQVLKTLVSKVGQVSSFECESFQMDKHHSVPLRVNKMLDHPLIESPYPPSINTRVDHLFELI